MLDKTELKTQAFRLEEATIDDLHCGIRSGAATAVRIVEQYLARVRAYNGVASMLVTADGGRVAEATGAVRAGAALKFPRETVKVSTILPDLDKYKGPPIEYGRMEANASKPDVQQQFGMIVGIPNGKQLNALGTLNIRGERSVTCWGEFDKHPSRGPLPSGAPPVCEFFRHQPDALERAAELDKEYRPQSRSREDADVWRGVLVQGPVRHQGHALDRRRRRPLRHRFSGARPRVGRAAPQQGRHHLRQGGKHRIQWPRRRSGRPQQARQGVAVDAWLSAQHLGRQSGEPVRHHAFGLARLELGLRRLGQRQLGHGVARRGDARVVPRAIQSQCGGADPAAQGDARLRWRCDRRRHLLRPRWHPRTADRGLLENPGCAEGPGARLLRRRDVFTTVPRSSVLPSYAGHAKGSGARARSRACGSASSASRWSIQRAQRPSSRSSMLR